MNPPAAIHSAMGRERKPFTYTPGGLDLSQIKSERMAKRLMRNAMNQGVPEQPQQITSPVTPTTPVAVPNFNCLPVQVFPAFQLPANPKSLLRSRSHPNKDPVPDSIKPNNTENTRPDSKKWETNNNDIATNINIADNQPSNIFNTIPKFNGHKNDGYKTNGNEGRPASTYGGLPSYMNDPAPCYDNNRPVSLYGTLPSHYSETNKENIEHPLDFSKSLHVDSGLMDNIDSVVVPKTPSPRNLEMPSKLVAQRSRQNSVAREIPSKEDTNKPTVCDSTLPNSANLQQTNIYETSRPDNSVPKIQNEVRVVKKQAKKETKTEEIHKEKQNGDNTAEAELTVTLPAKKSAAKTETKVEVTKKVLSDGTIEEVKTTTTKTTIDGRTETKIQTETKRIPKAEEVEEEFEEEEEEEVEEEAEESGVSIKEIKENGHDPVKSEPEKEHEPAKENGHSIIKKEERSETTTRKTVVVKSSEEPEEEIEEEVEEEEEEEEETEDVEEKQEIKEETKKIPVKQESVVEEEEEEVEEDEEVVEDEPKEDVKEEIKTEVVQAEATKLNETNQSRKGEQEEEEEEEYEEAEEEVTTKKEEVKTEYQKEEESSQTQSVEETKTETKKTVGFEHKPEHEKPNEPEQATKSHVTREIPVQLEKVEDVEIKPIGPALGSISRTRTESTEITTNTDSSTGPLTTEIHRVENVVVQNKITKKLDHTYEQITQQGIPTMKTYFAPTRDKISTSPTPSKPYQPTYVPEEKTERRHSLLLDRLSTERQLPPQENSYSIYNNQVYETQNQWAEEPRAEVLTVSNVKPSQISNHQWYQNTKKENVIYNNVTTPATPSPASQWNKPQQSSYQPIPQNRTPFSPEPQYQPTTPYQSKPPQPQSQPQYHQPQYQPQSQYQSQPQQQYQPEPPYQPPTQAYQPPTQAYQPPTKSYEPPTQTYQPPVQTYQPPAQTYQPPAQTYQPPMQSYQPSALTHQTATQAYQPQTQSCYKDYSYSKSTSNTYQQKNYPSYTPTSNTWGSTNTETQLSYDTQSNQISNKDSYNQSTQQYPSSYVPPPWEQDPNYSKAGENTVHTFYQPVTPSANSSQSAPSWQPAKPTTVKYSKTKPVSYIPPAPNQSFVKPVTNTEPPKIPGKKSYYSEYERRFIHVPESTYVPGDNKQPQSAQYYYDNDEAAEKEEHAWRKELREFSQKTTQPQYSTEQTRPPWEEESYPKTAPAEYTPQPTWSQTLKPRSGRERTFESEYSTQEYTKTNTLGRGRPLSTFVRSTSSPVAVRARGVSVDRYNPTSYRSPASFEHPPVEGHTLTPANAPRKNHYNPHVPAYHNSRASAEPRELGPQQGQRRYHDNRSSPVQSRSFKYLQWITGTDE